jgi:ankyrin repeat protein
VSRYYIPLEPAHLFVTQACLSLLLQLDNHVSKKSIKEFPLARYASQYWADHAEFGNVSSHVEDLIKRLFNPNNHHYANWVWIYNTISDKSMPSESSSRPTFSPLHHAAHHGFLRVVEWLITACSQDVHVLGDSRAPLHIASSRGQSAVVRVLLKHRADVNAVVERDLGRTSLHLASWHEHFKIARLLLEHGANVDFKDRLSVTPLALASERGNLELVQLLLEHGADTNAHSKFGMNSLYLALLKDHQDVAQLLLKHGADPNARDVDGQTLLHVSSKERDPNVAHGLLELGVDVNSRDKQGWTPLQVALTNREEKVAEILLQHGAKWT